MVHQQRLAEAESLAEREREAAVAAELTHTEERLKDETHTATLVAFSLLFRLGCWIRIHFL